MQKNEHIVRYTADELDEILAREGSKSDWARVDALTEEELEASIDWADEGVFDWSTTQPGLPEPRAELTLQLDPLVIDWFKANAEDYQARINAVLLDHIQAQKKRRAAAANH